ncbi:hypothetical protein E4U58_000953, partial [Claviceps cyperi]
MAVINLRKLLGGPQFLAKLVVDFNGYGLKVTALIDTGAGGNAFGTSEQLPEDVPIVGFDGKPDHVVSRVWAPSLIIDNDDKTTNSMPDKDAERRNRLLDWEDKRRRDGRRKRATLERPKVNATVSNGDRTQGGSPKVQMAIVGAAGYLHSAKKKDCDSGLFSIVELYAHIEKDEQRHETPLRGLEEDQDGLVQMIREKLPKEYWDYADVFSKMGAEQLPPRRPEFDHKIRIAEGHSKEEPLRAF